MSNDPYPTDDELEKVKTWPYTDGWMPLLEWIHDSLWWMADWGWHERNGRGFRRKPERVYEISTGGWSGNESVISALQDNYMFWGLNWQSSRRGGHYIFRVGKELDHELRTGASTGTGDHGPEGPSDPPGPTPG